MPAGSEAISEVRTLVLSRSGIAMTDFSTVAGVQVVFWWRLQLWKQRGDECEATGANDWFSTLLLVTIEQHSILSIVPNSNSIVNVAHGYLLRSLHMLKRLAIPKCLTPSIAFVSATPLLGWLPPVSLLRIHRRMKTSAPECHAGHVSFLLYPSAFVAWVPIDVHCFSVTRPCRHGFQEHLISPISRVLRPIFL